MAFLIPERHGIALNEHPVIRVHIAATNADEIVHIQPHHTHTIQCHNGLINSVVTTKR